MAPALLRNASPGDAAGVRGLFSIVHERSMSPELFAWRWEGREAVRTVAVDGGHVIGHLGTWVCELETPKGLRRGGLWADLMVHPERRNLALFMDMAEAHLAACSQAGLAALYAFPNDRSYPLLKRLFDFDDLGDLAAFEGPRPGNGRSTAVAGLPPEAELDAFWERVRPSDALALRRTGEWAARRYLRRPESRYGTWHVRAEGGRLSGWAAAKVFEPASIGDILDLWAEDAASETALVSAALSWMGPVRTVSAWGPPGDPRRRSWEGLGLSPSGPRTHFVSKALDPLLRPFTGDPALWRIAKGDSDVF